MKPLGLVAFDALRAEDEPWLSACFVPPRDLDMVAGSRSVLIFGTPGSGKTALYRALLWRCLGTDGKPVRLVARWKPALLYGDGQEDSSASTAVHAQIARVFDACAVALLSYLAQWPEDFTEVPGWAQDTLVWFVHRYGQGNLQVRLMRLLEESEPAGVAVLNEMLEAPASEVPGSWSAPDRAATRLVEALSVLGLNGVWVLSDGLEGWAASELEQLTKLLTDFLSTLPLFELPKFTYKLLVPSRLEPELVKASGLSRRRVDGYHIRWDTPALQQIVERRLALAIGRDTFTLAELCDVPELIQWLERSGGTAPREWLNQVRPLVSYYQAHSLNQPIQELTWKELRRQHPPRLYLDEATQQIIVGGRRISLEDLPGKGYDMLAYLYGRSGEVVSKAELYFRGYRGLDRVPRSQDDEEYEFPKAYEGLIDTAIWRLRKAIEPDPSAPVLLETIKGRGVCLKGRW